MLAASQSTGSFSIHEVPEVAMVVAAADELAGEATLHTEQVSGSLSAKPLVVLRLQVRKNSKA